MSHLKLQKKIGKVVSFNRTTGNGQVSLGTKKFPFEVTSFRGTRFSRSPVSGQTVLAILSGDGKRLVSVWVRDEK